MKLSKNANIFIKLSILVLVFMLLVFSTAFTREISYRNFTLFYKTPPPGSITGIARNIKQENPDFIIKGIGKKNHFITILVPGAQAQNFYIKHQTDKLVKKILVGNVIKFPTSEIKKSKKIEVSIGFFFNCPADSSLAVEIVKKNHGSIKKMHKGLNHLTVEVKLDKAEEFLLKVIENNSVKFAEFSYATPAYLF